MATPPVNPSPKVRFMDSPQTVSTHKDLIASRAFERACDFALLEYQARLADLAKNATDFNSFAANGMRIQGAQEFLFILRSLAEVPARMPVVVAADNLSHHS